MEIKTNEENDKICKNCQCRKGRHYWRIGGLICPAYKNSNNPKFFEEEDVFSNKTNTL